MSEDRPEAGGTYPSDAGAPSPGAGRLSLHRLLPALILAAGLAAFFLFDLHHLVSPEALKQHREALRAWVSDFGIWSVVLFGIVYAAAAAFSIPAGAVLTIAGGFLFGPFVATLCVVVAATTGATAVFLAARHAFAETLRARTGPAIRRIEEGFNENGMSYMLILRLVPLFPFALINLAPAFLGVPLRTFVIGTFFGIIPGSFVYALVGDGAGAVFDRGGNLDLGVIFEPRVLAPIIGLAVLAVMPIAYRKWRAHRGRKRDRPDVPGD